MNSPVKVFAGLLALTGIVTLVYFFILKEKPMEETSGVRKKYFISQESDTVLESTGGLVFYIPKNAFKNGQGNSPESVEVHITALTSLEDIILSGINLPAYQQEEALKHAALFKIEAFSDGKELVQDKLKTVYAELPKPTGEKAKVYKGEEQNGKVSWSLSEKEGNYLIPIDIKSLDIYPEGFKDTLRHNLPFRSHQNYSEKLADSLLLSFSFTKSYKIERKERVITLAYGADSTVVDNDTLALLCGTNTAGLKAFIDPEFQQTFIATHEFERRLRKIFQSCNPSILNIYVENVHLNLWEADSLAAKPFEDESMGAVFRKFSRERLTNVKDAPKESSALFGYYSRKTREIEKEIRKMQKEYWQQLQEEEEKAAAVRAEYRELLKKREEYRMEKFGFTLTETGWYSIASRVYVEELEKFSLEVKVQGGGDYDRVNTYILNPEIKSLFSMVSSDKENFSGGYDLDKHLLLKKGGRVIALAVGYKADSLFFSADTFPVKPNNQLLLIPSFGNKEMLKNFTSAWSEENKVLRDLEYQEAFYQRKKQLEKRRKQNLVVAKLGKLVNPCCSDND